MPKSCLKVILKLSTTLQKNLRNSKRSLAEFIRNFLNPKNNDQLNILSKNYFKKDISSDEVLKDLNSVGYNNFLTLKENYLKE